MSKTTWTRFQIQILIWIWEKFQLIATISKGHAYNKHSLNKHTYRFPLQSFLYNHWRPPGYYLSQFWLQGVLTTISKPFCETSLTILWTSRPPLQRHWQGRHREERVQWDCWRLWSGQQGWFCLRWSSLEGEQRIWGLNHSCSSHQRLTWEGRRGR